MSASSRSIKAPLLWRRLSIVTLAAILGGPTAAAQTAGAGRQPPSAPTTSDLQRQIAELRAQIARLQAAVDRSAAAAAPAGMPMGAKPPGGAMPAMAGMMGMMNMDKGEMGMPPEGMRMPPAKMGGMDAMEMGGMTGMGKAPADTGMAGMSMPATAPAPASVTQLPGYSGSSHLYHVGATGFFLDQPSLQLSDVQQAALNAIKAKALLARAESERQASQAEEELWTLTGAPEPDAALVAAKVQEVERIRARARLTFIEAVGEATRILTPAQRAALLGTSP